ncbi:MAG: hypothetical protein R2729_23540 [Bryobacteraceae bacterium]
MYYRTLPAIVVIAGSWAAVAQAATLPVGPTTAYSSPCAALTAAQPGDTIEVDAETTWLDDFCVVSTPGITIRASGPKRAAVVASGKKPLAAGDAIWRIAAAGIKIEGFEFRGANAGEAHGAAIHVDPGHGLELLDCYIHDNDAGLVVADGPAAKVLVARSEFANNGAAAGALNNIEVGRIGKFTLLFSYLHDPMGGNLVSSRAAETHILYNRLTQELGTGSSEIDATGASRTFVIGNTVQHGPNSVGGSMVRPGNELVLVNNTLVNEGSEATFIDSKPAGKTEWILRNNILHGPGSVIGELTPREGNWIGNADFVDGENHNYRLKPTSKAINSGVIPGDDPALRASFEYVHPLCAAPRLPVGPTDAGAAEFGSIVLPDCQVALETAKSSGSVSENTSKAATARQAALFALLGFSSPTPSASDPDKFQFSLVGLNAAPAAIQWTLLYPAGAFDSIQVAAGPSAIAAGKSVSCASATVAEATKPSNTRAAFSTGTVAMTCILAGTNLNALANGEMAIIYLQLSKAVAVERIRVNLAQAMSATELGDRLLTRTTHGSATVGRIP